MGKYKVFISFKNTDNGAETKDAGMATELYNALTDNNIPTFFSKVSILESGEGDYRNLIDAALDECSILIAVGTKKQYLTSRWVKYEYASFHEDILSGNKDADKCTVCSYIADMQQRDLPRPLRNLQAFEDMDTLLNFVKNHIRKIDEAEQNQNEDSISEVPAGTTIENVVEAAAPESAEDQYPVEEVSVEVSDTESAEATVTEKPFTTEEKKHDVAFVPENAVTVKKPKKKAMIGILAALAAIVVIVLVSTIINVSKNVVVPVVVDGASTELEFRVDDSYVSISSAELNKESMTALAEIVDMENISLTDCTFTDSSYEMLEDMPLLHGLAFKNVQGITDFSFLNDCTLSEIKLINCGLSNDNHGFGESVNDVCVSLDLSENANFSDLGFVQNFTALQKLTFDSTPVYYLNHLKNHPSLKVISFRNCNVMYIDALAEIDLNEVYGDNNSIYDISPLAGLENLEYISFENNSIAEVIEEFRSLRLKHINLNNNPIRTLTGFKNLTILEKLYFGKEEPEGMIAENTLTIDTGFGVLIERNAQTLKELDVSYAQVTRENLSSLTNAVNLQVLDISGIATADLSFLENCSGLKKIYAENCGLNNIDTLAVTSSLIDVRLAGNSIKDASLLTMDRSAYVYLDLSDNGVDIGSLPILYSGNMKFSELLLYGNKIIDLSFLDNANVEKLGITYDESFDPSMINCNVYIENLPEHKIVAYEDAVKGKVAVGRYSLTETETKEE